MNRLKSKRMFSLLMWTVLALVSIVTMPNLDELVREKGQLTIPETAQSAVAEEILKKMDDEQTETYSIIAVFNSGSEESLSVEQRNEIDVAINELKNRQEELRIKEIVSHLDNEAFEEQFVSEDGTTILTQLSVSDDVGDVEAISESINQVIEMESVDTYLTGSYLITNDFMNSTQDGVQKTEIIAVIFILVILVLVFRSPVVPLISLLTVGVSYIVSLGIIAQLVDHFNFPFSNFTQVFLVVVLFGVGTDYNILLYTRFKEELGKQTDVDSALKVTMKSAGKSVVYSGIAVLIGFAALILAKFQLYQATSGVAIGVAVLLVVLVTLNPFFMVLLGKKMFYPVKTFKGHEDSKLWGWITKYSIARPILAILFVGILSIPFILSYSNTLNYNDLLEVNDKYESKQGITVIEEHFPPGFSSPATLVIEAETPIDKGETLQLLDELAEKISTIEGVSEVLSPTRPTGEKIEGLYINEQAEELQTGLKDANYGVGEINDGLSSAEQQLRENETNDLANVEMLIDGTSEVKNGVAALGEALSQLKDGFDSGTTGVVQIEEGLTEVKDNLETISSATEQLSNGYEELANGLSSYQSHFSSISVAIDGAKEGYQQIEALMQQFIEANPEMASDGSIQQTLMISGAAQEQLTTLSIQLEQLTEQHQIAMDSMTEANAALEQVASGQLQLTDGVSQLQNGATLLKSGLQDGANGSEFMYSKTGELQAGLIQINDGQEQLLSGLNELEEKMAELQEGLVASTEGLTEVNDGLKSAEDYLSHLSQSKSSEKFYIPQDVLESEDFQEALDAYMSADRMIATMTIILNDNPYSKEAMPVIDEINQQIESALNGTELQSATIGISGTTAINVDLKEITQQDFIRTAIIMLIGIFIVLIFITKSVANSIYIIGSLVVAYFVSLGISEFLSAQFLGIDNLSWNVPFFSFIMIIALGVDYSIFMMMRYNELEGSVGSKILEASRHIGGVVLSAAIILGGTFAALIPSGVLTLIQVALVVIVGLMLLSLLALPLFVPAMMQLVEKIKTRFKQK